MKPRRATPAPSGQTLEQIRASADRNPSPVLMLGADGSLLYANPASGPLIEGSGWKVGSPLPARWRERVAATLRRERPRVYEVRPGDYVFQLTLTPWPEQKAVVAFGYDITVAQTLSSLRDIRGRREALESQVRLFADLASGWGRRMGPPVSAAAERAEELVLRLERGEDPQSLLTLAGDLCATLRSLGHELRALSGLAPLRDRTGSTPAAAPQIFTEVLALCRGRFQAADVELRVGEVPAEIWLKGRAGELVTALFGLLNAALAAVEFASPKGTGSRWVAVDVTPHDQTLRVRITWPGPLPKDEASLVAVDLAREALEAHGGRLNPEDSPQGQWVLDLSKAA